MPKSHSLLTAAILAIAAAPLWAQLPDGPGKDALQQVCAKCHDAEVVDGYHQSRSAWAGTISQMIDKGAEGTDDQFKQILDYLVKNFGPKAAAATPAAQVNVNKADATELQTQLELTAKEAEAIVKYRGDNGPFKAIADLKNVPDLDYKKIEAKQDRLTF